MMVVIVGLGNPGEKFEDTRHNVGYEVVERLRERWGFSDWQTKKKLAAEISQGEIAGTKVVLAKPLTFMNNSGQAVKKLLKTYNLKPNNLIIVHDDIDLPLSKIRISQARGAAGHKGVASIIQALGTDDLVRFRIGIKPENNEQGTMNEKENKELCDFVLERFKREERQLIKESLKKVVEAMETALEQGLEKAMTLFNR